MPSYEANSIIRMLNDVLGKPLTTAQQLQCEEIIINVYPGAVRRFIRSWTAKLSKKQGKVLTFDHFYIPIMSGIIVGAMKNKKENLFRFDNPTKKLIYAAMHTYLGTDFTLRELEDIVWFTKCSTKEELQTAINVAQHHGVVNCAYVRAIIVGNRRKAAALLRSQDERFKKLTDDPPNVLTGVPNVKSLQEAWTRRLKNAIDRSTEEDVERSAAKKQIQEHQ